MNQQRQSIPIIIASAILLIAASLACGIATGPDPNPLATPSATVSGQGTLIFQSRQEGNAEIYRVQADGTGLTNLTNDPGDDIFAVWSPDGKQIAFNSDRSGRWALYVMNADGSNPRRLSGLKNAGRPAWSPDGQWIALPTGLIISADGSGQRPAAADNDEPCSSPVWSPDGGHIACKTGSGSGTAIAVRNVDLGQTTYLKVRRFNEFPAWSPDGARIAFLTWDTGFTKHNYIYTANPDGSGLINLTDDPAVNGAPAWSPDGARIACITRQYGGVAIQVMNADGAGKFQLTYNHRVDEGLAWSPDSTRIAFAASPAQTATPRPGQPALPRGLFIINADGSAQIQLAAGAAGAGGLSWQPIGP
jgi:TolB protein